jgi:flavin reductase (DIM6/NTAB) family NADH-FMN oxidoreductase RutF
MTKDLGAKPYLFPMPTYMIGTYNEDDSVDVMMMAWHSGVEYMKEESE